LYSCVFYNDLPKIYPDLPNCSRKYLLFIHPAEKNRVINKG
jgi:hypothetical protein